WQRFIPAFALAVHDLAPEALGVGPAVRPEPAALRAHVEAMLAAFAAETGAAFPEAPRDQLEAAVRALARRWHAPTTRILRAARGAPEEAGLGLIVQEMALGIGSRATGTIQLVDPRTGAPEVLGDLQLDGERTSLHEMHPQALTALRDACTRVAHGLGD